MSKTKTVLFITHGLPPESYGGVEVYINNLFNEFKKSDTFFPILLSRTNYNKFWTNLIWSDERDPQKFYTHTPHVDIFNLTNQESDDFFKEFLINTKPDIIHFEHYLHLSLSWFKIAKETLPNTKIVLTTHEYMGICPNSGQMIKTKWQNNTLCNKSSLKECSKCFPYIPKKIISDRRKNIKLYFSYIDLFTGPSNFIKSRYVDLGIKSNKFLVSENGQHIFEHKADSNNRQQSGQLKLIYIGQINYFKGLQILLEAMEVLTNYNISLDIYGKMQDDQEYNQNILEKIKQLDNVKFHGPYSQTELPNILSLYDCLVVPSIWWENSPLVIQEAFMAKIPVICSNIGGMAEKVTNQKNGLHFKAGDSKSLKQKILHIYNNPTLINLFKTKIPKVKSIYDNRIELESIYNQIA
jgi:glycosyltransferase involved in cell wall biosynthesis